MVCIIDCIPVRSNWNDVYAFHGYEIFIAIFFSSIFFFYPIKSRIKPIFLGLQNVFVSQKVKDMVSFDKEVSREL